MMMKKLQLLGVALVAVFAFGALTVASASAVTFLLALWLVNGAAVETALNVESTGELLLEDTKAVLGIKAMVLCSGSLMGYVEKESLDVISEVLTLDGLTTINTTALSETGLTCTNQENCAEPLLWAVNLPWDTEVELMEDTTVFFVDLILPHAGGGNPGWEVWCMGPNLTDTCTTTEGADELKLEGATLLGIFTEAFTELAGAKLAECSLGGAETGIVEEPTGGTVSLVGGGELTASSETSEA